MLQEIGHLLHRFYWGWGRDKTGDLISTVHDFLFPSQCLHKDDSQNPIDDLEKKANRIFKSIAFIFQGRWYIYINECQSHRHRCSPDGFIFQIPCDFVDTSIAEGMSCYSITALMWQGLTQIKIIVRSICSTTSNLHMFRWKRRKKKSIY
jgi:hypothetical protein